MWRLHRHSTHRRRPVAGTNPKPDESNVLACTVPCISNDHLHFTILSTSISPKWSFPFGISDYNCVETSWNVMAHVQKPHLVFRAKRMGPFKSAGTSVPSITGSRGVRISGSNAGYTMFRGSVKSTGYPLHSPVSPSLPLRCVTVCHHISTGVYNILLDQRCGYGHCTQPMVR